LPPSAGAFTLRIVNMPRYSTLFLTTLIMWALSYVIWLTNFVFEPVPFQLDHSLRGIPIFALGAMLSLGMGRMLDRLQGRADARTLTVAVVGTIIAATAVVAFFEVLVMHVIVPRWGGPTWTNVLEQIPMAWVFGSWVLLYFLLTADAARRDREVRLAQANAAAIDAQHRVLVQQINPHFLFNALNTVYALVLEGDDARACRCLLALSAFMRESIDRNAPRKVPLLRELELIRHYLEIEQIRFGERLHLDESVPSELLDRNVPALILQPLVENCIKHGLNGHAGPVTIWLSGALEQNELVLSIEDDGRSPPESDVAASGVGLDNVRKRLHLLYGDTARLIAHARPGGGFIARVHLPAS
jgi:two-component system LytT family sensor kinase